MIIPRFLNNEKKGGFCDMDPSIIFNILENVICLDFKHLYANLIIQFYDNGVFKLNDNIFKMSIDRLRYLLSKDEKSSDDIKFINSFYGKLYDVDREIALDISSYFNAVLQHIFNSHYSNIYYCDTDVIYMSHYDNHMKEFIDKLNLPYTLKSINNIFFIRKKQYLYHNDVLKIRGLRDKDIDNLNLKPIINKFKKNIRNKKLESIGI